MPKANAKPKATNSQPKAARKSTRKTAKSPEPDHTLDSKTMDATEELKRLTREAVFCLFAKIEKYILTLDDKVAEHLRTVVINATEAVERLGFIIQEADAANAEPLWHLISGGEEMVDERKSVLGIVNKVSGTNLTLEDLDAAAILAGMANENNDVKSHTQEELDAAEAMIEMARGDTGAVDENRVNSSSENPTNANTPKPLQNPDSDSNNRKSFQDADTANDEVMIKIHTSNIRADPYILPNGTERAPLPLNPNFIPQHIPATASAGLSYTKKLDNETIKATRTRGHRLSEKAVKALAKAGGVKPYDNYVQKRKVTPDAFEDGVYPFHQYLLCEMGGGFGGDLGMGPEEVRGKMEGEGRLPSGKFVRAREGKRRRVG